MGPNYENSTVVAKGCYWNKRPFSNENEIHTNRPCQTLTYCRQKMVLTLGSALTLYICLTDEKGNRRYERVNRRLLLDWSWSWICIYAFLRTLEKLPQNRRLLAPINIGYWHSQSPP